MRKPATSLLVVDSLDATLVRPVSAPAAPTEEVLSPKEIRANLRKWETVYQAAKSVATVKAVRADWQVFLQWCETHSVWALPVEGKNLLKFLHDQVDQGKKRATIDRYLNTIRTIHRGAELPDPTNIQHWKLEWEAVVRSLGEKNANAPQQTEPLRTPQVNQILASLGKSPVDLRDAALISLASDTLCRESELAVLRLEDIAPSDAAGTKWSVDLRRSKTDQHGMGTARFCSAATKARIDAWCNAAGITNGYLFPPVGKCDTYTAPPMHSRTSTIKTRKPLGAVQVARLLRRRAVRAGLPNAESLTGHSGRVGSALDLLDAGYSVTQVQFAGGWKGPQQVLHYGKRALVGQGAMADLRAKQAEQLKDEKQSLPSTPEPDADR